MSAVKLFFIHIDFFIINSTIIKFFKSSLYATSPYLPILLIMNKSEPVSDPLKKLIHDLNGELFLIRGHLDLMHREINNNSQVMENFDKIQERMDEVQMIIKKYVKKSTR